MNRPTTRYAAESWSAASAMHARVVGAVIMRDLQTRFGTGYLGFLLGLIMPLGHLTITTVVMVVLGRVAPIGTDTAIFLMTGVLPFILWFYSHRQVMLTLLQNRPLLHFPGVDVFDLFFGRMIIEIVSATIVVSVVFLSLSLLGHDLSAGNWHGFIFTLIKSWGLGVSTGLFFGTIGSVWPPMIIIGNIMAPFLWATSGIFFLAGDIPDKISEILKYNPLCQIIDGVRYFYFTEYESVFYSELIINFTIIGIFLLGSIISFAVRRIS